jgi:hypothetical protein
LDGAFVFGEDQQVAFNAALCLQAFFHFSQQ